MVEVIVEVCLAFYLHRVTLIKVVSLGGGSPKISRK